MRLPGRLALAAAASGVLSGVLIGWAVPAQATLAAPAAHRVAPPVVQASGAALESASTGTVMWSRALDTKRPIASITKVMTALVVLRAGGLGRVITVPAAAVSYVRAEQGSSAGLHAGDRLTVQQLLEAMLLPSGCDAAYVLASAYGPGVAPFVAKMNALAARMHLGRTHFSNFDGLPVPTEYSTYSTPGNLLLIGRAAMAYPVFRAIVGQRRYHLAAGPGHHAYTWHNTNLLLGAYPGVTGIKTGDTKGPATACSSRRGAAPVSSLASFWIARPRSAP